MEFADHRRYQPGDDLRHLDTHLHRRTGEHYVRQYEVHRQLPVTIIIDGSASMNFGNPTKFAFACGLASALAFSVGAALPTLAAFLAPPSAVVAAVPAAALVFLSALGALGAWAGGAPIVRPAIRVAFWGALAMAVTAGVGALVGKAV